MEFVFTLCAQALLAKKFNHKKDEWKMIGKKSTSWINSKRPLLPTADQGVQEMVADIESQINSLGAHW